MTDRAGNEIGTATKAATENKRGRKTETCGAGKCLRIFLHTILLAAAVLLISGSLWMIYAKGIRKDPFPMPFGYGQAVVTSGSMSPAFEADALLIYQAAEEYEVGDIVAFSDDNGKLVTHRIIQTDGRKAVTKGDANSLADNPIEENQIYGKVIHIIPDAGKLVRALQSPVLILLLILLLFAGYEWNYSHSRNEEEAKPRTAYRRIPGSVFLTGFVLICALTTGQIAARFVNGAVGESSARVASFQVTTDLSEFETTIQAEMKPGESKEYSFDFTNESEIAVNMTAKLSCEGNLPLKISYKNTEDASKDAWEVLTENLVKKWETSQGTGYLSFTDNLEVNSGKKSYTIKIEWPEDKNNYRYKQGVLALQLKVEAEQAD